MRESINAAMGAAMESIVAEANLKDSLGGKLGKAVRSGLATGAFMCAGLFAAAAPVQAADNAINGGCILGAVAGGLLGSKIGDGSGQKVATAAGAVFGCKAGQDVQANSNYREQRQAGYGNRGRYAEPPRYSRGQQQQGYYDEPVVSSRPMQSYMPHTFAQLDGRESARRPLETQGRMAMDKALADAERAMESNIRAQQIYAQAYQQRDRAHMDSMNPEAQVLMGSGAMRDAATRGDQQLDRMARARNQANMNFGSQGMKLADLIEFEASRGFDIMPYADRILRVLNAPMSEPVSGINPARQRVTFATPSVTRGAPSY
jgi:hypothetical protein